MSTELNPLIAAAVEILRHAPKKELKITVLNKALFYFDLECLLEKGASATKAPFIAMEHGPVVAKYGQRLVKALDEAGIAKQANGDHQSKPIQLVADQGIPAHEFAEIAARVATRIGRMTAAEVSDLSHKNPGWKIAWAIALRKNKAPQAINMLVAMQELADGDDWLSAPITAEEKAAIDRTESTEPVDW